MHEKENKQKKTKGNYAESGKSLACAAVSLGSFGFYKAAWISSKGTALMQNQVTTQMTEEIVKQTSKQSVKETAKQFVANVASKKEMITQLTQELGKYAAKLKSF